MTRITTAIGILAVCSVTAVRAGEYGKERSLAVYFPAIKLDSANNERISGLSLLIKCGEIRELRRVPADWSFQSRGPISGVVQFHAGAGQGATWLWSIDERNGSIAIVATDQSCFDVSAEVYTDGQVDDRNQKIVLTRKQLKLRP